MLFLFVIMLIQASKNEITQFDLNIHNMTIYNLIFTFVIGILILFFIYIIYLSINVYISNFLLIYTQYYKSMYVSDTLYETYNSIFLRRSVILHIIGFSFLFLH